METYQKNVNGFRKIIENKFVNKDVFEVSLQLAYKDLQRTIKGIANAPKKNIIKQNSHNIIKEEINKLLEVEAYDFNAYAKWHKNTCELIKNEFLIIYPFTYGQAQKWLNMTLKYLYTIEQEKFSKVLPFLHIPIDNIIISYLKKNYKDFYLIDFNCAWSKLDDYNAYLKFQKWFVEQFEIPLLSEFYIWNNATGYFND